MTSIHVPFEESIYTLQDISELYNNHYNINKVYHFQYKSEDIAKEKFGNFQSSILDKDTHHSIYNVLSHKVINNQLILESDNKQVGKNTIAYNKIHDQYRFDIITSPIDGKTLIIYDTNIKKIK